MPISALFKVRCDKCENHVMVEVPITNSSIKNLNFDFIQPEGYEIKDIGSYKTKVTCPVCLAKESLG